MTFWVSEHFKSSRHKKDTQERMEKASTPNELVPITIAKSPALAVTACLAWVPLETPQNHPDSAPTDFGFAVEHSPRTESREGKSECL